jgi:hypothetical protein
MKKIIPIISCWLVALLSAAMSVAAGIASLWLYDSVKGAFCSALVVFVYCMIVWTERK